MIRGAGPFVEFHGPVFRQSRPRYAEATERTLFASMRAGGRFNPAGEFGALYVSLDPETPFRELRRQADHAGVEIVDLLPRTLFAMRVRLNRVLDLTSEAARRSCGISADGLTSDYWGACQKIARDARVRGCEAIRYPSATGEGENLAIFLDRLDAASVVDMVNPREVRPGMP